MDCNKTEVFLKELKIMCNSFKDGCKECPIWKLTRISMNCFTVLLEDPSIAIQAVQKWSDEHPIEIDWMKVPVDTPVLVRDYDNDKWKERYFVSYFPKNDSYKFLVFNGGCKQENASSVSVYNQCELSPEVDYTPYLKD